jgi:integrase
MTMELYRQANSKFWTADFVVDGRRVRKSTKKTTKSAALEVAMEFYRQAQQQQSPARKKRPPLLSEFDENRFLPFIRESALDADTKRYYETGWRLLSETPAKSWRLDQIKGSEADAVNFPGSGANANCGLRTLRRMLSMALDWEIIARKPRVRLRKEVERTAVFDSEMEKRFLEKAPQPLRDVFIISHDAGLRPDEVIRMRWENVLWKKNLISCPTKKLKTRSATYRSATEFWSC